MRTVILKYPFILSKSLDHLRGFFSKLEGAGLTKEEVVKALIDVPKLIS
jgi:hypothetical protein